MIDLAFVVGESAPNNRRDIPYAVALSNQRGDPAFFPGDEVTQSQGNNIRDLEGLYSIYDVAHTDKEVLGSFASFLQREAGLSAGLSSLPSRGVRLGAGGSRR